jgi:predicted ester cyclase
LGEDNTVILRRYMEEVALQGDRDAHDAHVHPDAVFGTGKELEEHRKQMAWIMSALGDISMTVEEMVAEGDKVAARVTVRGKQVGELKGRPGNGQQFEIEEFLIAEFRDGRISRIRRVADTYGLLHQLGVLDD